MQPPARHWIDQRWGTIGKVFPTLTMDWIYQEDGADRLKHHRWMLTRPTFRLAARGLHQMLAAEGDVVIDSVTQPDATFAFPEGTQRALAIRFFRHLLRPDGTEVSMFLVATACELLGITPLCAFQEAALKQWMAQALGEEMPHYDNVYGLLINIIAQTMFWILGCYPYTALKQQITPNRIAFESEPDPSASENLLLLRRYTMSLNAEMQRISKHPPSGRSYHESETH